jgi:AbrB family looped-hinge helix DNA binding protein
MKLHDHKAMTVQAVKLGASGQVVIPKIFHEELGLRPGDYFEAELHEGKVVLTPKVLVDKRVAQEIAASMEDFRKGRVAGPFTAADDLIASLHAGRTTRRMRTPRHR